MEMYILQIHTEIVLVRQFQQVLQYDVQCTKIALLQFADNVGPDQPAQMRRLIWAFIAHFWNQWIL